jgi:hypothetical protein
MAPPKEASAINPACGYFQLALLSLFDRKTATSAYEALSIPLLSPTSFLLAEFARIYTILFYEQNGKRTAVPYARISIVGFLLVPGFLQPKGNGRVLAFQYPIVSQDEVTPSQ